MRAVFPTRGTFDGSRARQPSRRAGVRKRLDSATHPLQSSPGVACLTARLDGGSIEPADGRGHEAHEGKAGQGGDRKKEQHSTGRCERLLGGRHRRAQHDEGRDERGRRERRAPADAKLGERREAAQGDDPCGEGPRIVRYAERERVRRKQEPEEDDGIDRRDDQRPHEA